MSQSIVILDDGPGQNLGRQLSRVLSPEDAYRVDLVERVDVLAERFGERVPEVLIPVLPRGVDAAHQLLSQVRVPRHGLSIMAVVPPESLSGLLDSLVTGDDEFLVSPLVDAEIRIRVGRLTGSHRKPAPTQPERVLENACALKQIVGEDASMLDLKRKIRRVAHFESNVLLTGETGTGKERSAHALHYVSRRASKPFVAVNCGAIPAELFESEMYGHERGAFTGAHVARPGLIAAAEGGTLFLDEIETLNLATQVKLLRFLQDQLYYPVGSAKPKQADVWVVTASNVDLLARAKAGQFREDLFYRLAAIALRLPPLRERKADIPLLAAYFLKMHGARHGTGEQTFSACALRTLREYEWPGNVRELENAILQAIVFSEGGEIEAKDLPIPQSVGFDAPGPQSFQRSKVGAIEQFERNYVAELLEIHGGNVTRAALAAKKERRAFGRLIKKYEINCANAWVNKDPASGPRTTQNPAAKIRKGPVL